MSDMLISGLAMQEIESPDLVRRMTNHAPFSLDIAKPQVVEQENAAAAKTQTGKSNDTARHPAPRRDQRHSPRNGSSKESGQKVSDDAATYLTIVYPEHKKKDQDKHEDGEGGSANDEPEELDDSLDSEILAGKIAPMTGDDGIFEILFPDGGSMGVVVNTHSTHVNFILSPSDDSLSKKLKNTKMELKSHLERRIGRQVSLTVL